jgi:hypothetical protein
MIKCCFVIIVMVNTIYFASSRSSLKFPPTFGIVHHVLLQHLDFYSNHVDVFFYLGLGGGGGGGYIRF